MGVDGPTTIFNARTGRCWYCYERAVRRGHRRQPIHVEAFVLGRKRASSLRMREANHKGAKNKAASVMKTGMGKKSAHVLKHVLKRPAGKLAGKHFAYTGKLEAAKPSRTHTGGLFATVDMANMPNNGNLVLHVVEMLHNVNKSVKEHAIRDMRSHGFRVGIYVHHCSCQLKTAWEGLYCDTCLLDGFH